MALVPASQPSWRPATLADRGVAVPFTTPRLAGARARFSERGLDLIIPNPSGARGVYILQAASLPEYCAATLHDLCLVERMANLTAISPRRLRHAARQIAAEGLAGRGAREAAMQAEQRARTDRMLMHQTIVRRLVAGDQSRVPSASPAYDPGFDERARACILRLADSLGRPAGTVTLDLETLAELFIDIGLDAAQDGARCPALIETISRTEREIQTWSQANQSCSRKASIIAAHAGQSLRLAREAVAEARARAADLPRLLRDVAETGEGLALDIERADWLLDGWDMVCLLWHLAEDDAGRTAALADMESALPVMPLELQHGLDAFASERDAPKNTRPELGRSRPFGTLDLIARNERMRALLAA